jgi:hypothetical protein
LLHSKSGRGRQLFFKGPWKVDCRKQRFGEEIVLSGLVNDSDKPALLGRWTAQAAIEAPDYKRCLVASVT